MPSHCSHTTRAPRRLDMSMRDTPPSVSVATRRRMDDMGLNSLADVLGQSTGAAVRELDSERINFTPLPSDHPLPAALTALLARADADTGRSRCPARASRPPASLGAIRPRPAPPGKSAARNPRRRVLLPPAFRPALPARHLAALDRRLVRHVHAGLHRQWRDHAQAHLQALVHLPARQPGLAQAYTEGCKLRPGNLCWLLTRPSMSAGATARLR